ncbi:MAG: MFS transporter [Candidatus Thorarchaeota archaeon]
MEENKIGYRSRIGLFKKDARLFIASNAAGAFSWGISGVILNLYLVESGFGEDFLGLFLSISMFGTAFIAVLAGMFSDRRSRKPIILTANVVTFISFIIAYTTLDPVSLILSQVMFGLSSAFSQVSWFPYITDLSTDEERAHLFGIGSGISLLAVLAGNLLGGFLPDILMNILPIAGSLFIAYRFTLLISLIPMAISTIMVLPMTKDKPIEKESSIGFSNVTNWGFIGKYATTVTVVGLGAGMIVMYFNIFFKNEFTADSSLIGIIFGINTLVLAAGNFLAPAMADRIGKVKTVVITEALSVPFLLMISWAPVLYLAVIAYVSRTALMNMSGPVANAFFMEGLTKEERATAVGVMRSGDSFVRGVSALIGGWLLAMGLYRLPYVLVSALYVLSVILFYSFFKNKEQEMKLRKETKVVVDEIEIDEEEYDIT